MEMKLIDRIEELKRRQNAVILAHNYQPGEIQDIADYVGDSLELSRLAAATDAAVIVFCGVHFMAETAFILSPEKIVILPDLKAGCPLADMITAEALREKRREYPDAKVVCYVNSSAAVKAESDVCCTSANAVRIVESLDGEKVIFVPDRNLGAYVSSRVDKEVILWDGACHVHDAKISLEQVTKLKREHPGARFMAHPECHLEVLRLADEVCGTSGMVRYARESVAGEIIVGTEVGIVYRLKKENPGKVFYPIETAICPDMKLITLEKIVKSLETLEPRVVIPEDVRLRAEEAVKRMVELV
ncbi:MAG: quinolinate synthase NadA [Actinomycetota bacterium]|nr:quinolinate synthase NadA [Actinomycetota bacterium]